MESLDTQKETKTAYHTHFDVIAVHIEDFPEMDIIFKGPVKITYDKSSKNLVITAKNLITENLNE